MVARVLLRRIAKVATPRGNDARSMTSLNAPYSLQYGQPVNPNVNFSYTGQSWFGPLPPMAPIAPPQVAGRQWDFIPGFNYVIQPRAYETVDFPTLKALADAYDPLRLLIERRKDQMLRLPWQIRPKHEGPGRHPKVYELSQADQDRIAFYTSFFKRPDYECTFRGWFRAVLEDFFVTDAPTLYAKRSRGGDLISLQYVDGGTIKRVIDDWGRMPQPVAASDLPIQWNGVTITEENWYLQHFKHWQRTPGWLYPPAFQQVLKGLPAVDYSSFELFYRPFNLRPGKIYGFSPVEQVFMTVNIALRRQFHQFEYYREGNLPEGIIRLPESWTPDQIQRYQDYWDTLLSGNLGARRHIKFVPGSGGAGNGWTPMKEPPLKNEFDEWLARVICLAFSYPPNALVSLSNRAVAQQHEKQAEEEGLQPIKQWAVDLFNEILEVEFGQKDLEFAYLEEEEVDQEKQGKILVGYSTNGALTLNEVRERIGIGISDNPVANRLMVKTANGFVPVEAFQSLDVGGEGDGSKPSDTNVLSPFKGANALKPKSGGPEKKVSGFVMMVCNRDGAYVGRSGRNYGYWHQGDQVEVSHEDVEGLKDKGWTLLHSEPISKVFGPQIISYEEIDCG